MRVRCGWQGGGAALVLVAVAGVAAISPTGPAGAAANYHGVATADAARVTVIVPNAPATSSIVDTGLTSAQAVVSSGGTSKAFGSNPYPGDNAVTLPGTLAGFGSEYVASFESEWVAGFVGIRTCAAARQRACLSGRRSSLPRTGT